MRLRGITRCRGGGTLAREIGDYVGFAGNFLWASFVVLLAVGSGKCDDVENVGCWLGIVQ